jgi:hypothetical protein
VAARTSKIVLHLCFTLMWRGRDTNGPASHRSNRTGKVRIEWARALESQGKASLSFVPGGIGDRAANPKAISVSHWKSCWLSRNMSALIPLASGQNDKLKCPLVGNVCWQSFRSEGQGGVSQRPEKESLVRAANKPRDGPVLSGVFGPCMSSQRRRMNARWRAATWSQPPHDRGIIVRVRRSVPNRCPMTLQWYTNSNNDIIRHMSEIFSESGRSMRK